MESKPSLTIVEDEELGTGVAFTAPTRKTTGPDSDPIDALTGEPVFDDIDSRFGISEPASGGKKKSAPDVDVEALYAQIGKLQSQLEFLKKNRDGPLLKNGC